MLETEQEILKDKYLREHIFPKEEMCEHGNWGNCYFCNAKKKVLVALSGGVDSSAAAALLKQRGFRVIGVHLQMNESNYDAQKSAEKVAQKLNIPFHVFDVKKEFKKEVVDYFIAEYEAGRTPNPCVVCNKKIKFGWLLDKARKLGCDYIASGHYARLGREIRNLKSHSTSLRTGKTLNKSKIQNTHRLSFSTESRALRIGNLDSVSELHSVRNDTMRLFQAKDTKKDQTYFLWQLSQEQLKHVLFPIGDYTKHEVRELAKKFNLPTYNKPESQDICFLGGRNIADFLKKYADNSDRSGNIIDKSGNILGKHKGLIYYTIGQRSGIPKLKIKNCPPCREAGKLKIERDRIPPLYVVKLDIDKNELVIGLEKDLYSKKLKATCVNWINSNIAKKLLGNRTINCQAKIRYGHISASCQIVLKTIKQGDNITIIFDKPQRAITPGQSVVIYKNNEVMGGGIIK